jgi:hypothetical protein
MNRSILRRTDSAPFSSCFSIVKLFIYCFLKHGPLGANQSANFAAHFPFGPPKGSKNELTRCGTIATQRILNSVNNILKNNGKIN